MNIRIERSRSTRARYRLVVIGLLATFAAGVGCDSNRAQTRSEGDDSALKVVATIGMIADAASRIGGECVTVTGLMGPGVDPHVYRASAGDVETLRSAEVILYGGMLLEGRMADVLGRLSQRTATLAVLETIDEGRLLSSTTIAGHHDPHLWMDVAMWVDATAGIEAALIELRPSCEQQMRDAAVAYRAELTALHGWVAESIASIPRLQRALVTAHDAFSYFGRAYDMDVIGIQGVSTEAEASVTDIRHVVDEVTQRRVPAIFVESSVNPRNIEAVRAAARDRGFELGEGGQLFSDAMGEHGTWRGTYIGMIRSNVETIVDSLGGTTAPWPDALSEWAQRWTLQ